MKKTRILFAAALLAAPACDSADDNGSAAPVDTAAHSLDGAVDTGTLAGTDSSSAERAETREDTIMVEGMAEVERATLVRSPAGFGVPFSTYVSNGLRTEFRTEGAGASVRFSAAFGGIPNRNAYLQLYLYEPDVPRPFVHDIVAGFVRSRSPASDETRSVNAPPWAQEALGFSYTGTGDVRFTGRVMTGEHNGRYFHVIVHYPAEYGDGMGARVDYVLRQWRWEDTGEMLMR